MSLVSDFPPGATGRGRCIAKMIDISAVQANYTRADIESLALTAAEGGFIAAHVLPSWVPFLSTKLAASETRVGAPAGFPSGGTASEVKRFEAEWLIDNGVEEMDIVMNIGLLRSGELQAVEADIRSVIETVAGRVPTKVILEVGHLQGEELERAAESALRAGATSLKTGTGWSGVATTPEHVSRIREVAGPDVEIKASGGVRTINDFAALYDAGARRFGANVAAAKAIVQAAEDQS